MSKRTSEAARARIAAQREALRKQEQRKRTTTIIAVVVIAVVAVAIGWWSMRQGESEKVTGGLAPVTIQQDGSVVMAKPGVTAPVVDVYEDYQCPACKQLEETSGSTLKNLAAEGKAKVVYHMITIFSDEPAHSNSLRAANAARCVTDGSQYMKFHDLLYQRQPSETETGFSPDDLVKWGKEAGVTAPDFETCVRQQRNVSAHDQYTSTIMSSLKLSGTPTVMLNGQSLDTGTAFVPSALRDAVVKAPSKG
ncbi:DsbA family protein [Microbispora sp. ATCC PTA-5024]|uniref:DsbA family protein n=1 Tax=Microbispora sp. ATCC PTA-5024 TaxID=316330 RepID=UPI0003DD0813|nr:thioredoxin domain-containing protein [Microbispora sp. ATCC PTA-5024]ETK36503.1 protein-disulfide isomerase [Microbispora sp. ATCC PTA-5024]